MDSTGEMTALRLLLVMFIVLSDNILLECYVSVVHIYTIILTKNSNFIYDYIIQEKVCTIISRIGLMLPMHPNRVYIFFEIHII